MLTKFEICAFLGMPYNTSEDCIFFRRYDKGAIPNYFKIFRSEGKGDIFNSLPKSPTFAKCHDEYSRCINRHLFHTFSRK